MLKKFHAKNLPCICIILPKLDIGFNFKIKNGKIYSKQILIFVGHPRILQFDYDHDINISHITIKENVKESI